MGFASINEIFAVVGPLNHPGPNQIVKRTVSLIV